MKNRQANSGQDDYIAQTPDNAETVSGILITPVEVIEIDPNEVINPEIGDTTKPKTETDSSGSTIYSWFSPPKLRNLTSR